MSNISQQRLIEMEAEMDRFEQEILSQPSASDLPRVVIGSNTYSQVSAQLKMLRAQSGMSRDEREKKQREVADQLRALRAATEIHEQEDSEDEGDEPDKYSIVDRQEPPAKKPAIDPSLGMLPPPPPPPSLGVTPSFVPPQLRHRAPPPPPPSRPPMGGPPRMRPPPPPPSRHPYGGPGPMGPGPHSYPGPHPGMGPMGGPGPGPMRMPGPPMGPRPGFMPGPGPGPMQGGPNMDSGGMYGVSTGDDHKDKEKAAEKVEEKPKVIYASAPVITVPKKEKEKKKKKKKKNDETEEGGEDHQGEGKQTAEVRAGPTLPKSLQGASSHPEPEDNFQVADMDIDGQAMPGKQKKEKKKKFVRMAAGKAWEDPSLGEWDPDDFRLFCGDLGNEVTDEVLARAFNKYSSFVKAKVVRDKRSNKTKGYGFVSFRDPNDYVRAMREMNGKYVGNRPIKLRKSMWKDRNIDIVKKKDKEKKRLGLR